MDDMTSPVDLTKILDPTHLGLPKRPKVVEIRAQPYIDSAGDQGLRVMVMLDEATSDRDRSLRKLRPIEDAIFRALREAQETRFPYMRFLKKSELD